MTTCAEERTAILIFARAPVPGATKTRLIPRMGARAAARLHERMTQHVITAACNARIGTVQLWCEPTTAHPFFRSCVQRYGVTLHTQTGCTLGERMLNAYNAAHDLHRHILLIGTDCPILTSMHLVNAASGLASHDAAIIPAEDGGYVLLALSRPCPEAFDEVDWGSSQVLEQTLKKLRDAHRSVVQQESLWDVDRAEDVHRLAHVLPELLAEL